MLNTFAVIDDFEVQPEQKPPKKPRPNLHLDNLADFMADVDTAPTDLPTLQHLRLEGAPCQYYAGPHGIHGEAAHGAIVAEIKDANGTLVDVAILRDVDGLADLHCFKGESFLGAFICIGTLTTDKVLVTTSWTDGMALHRATSLSVAVVLSADNIYPVAEQLAARYSDVQMTICVSPCGNEPALFAATETAHRLRIGLAIPPNDHQTFLEAVTKVCGKALRQCLDSAEVPNSPIPNKALCERVRANLVMQIEELATLDDESFFPRMSAAGQLLGLPEANVHYLRKAAQRKDLQHGEGMKFPPTPNHPYPIPGENLLQELLDAIRRYVIMSKYCILLIALFVIFTFSVHLWDIAPILLLQSPTKRCGKTTVLKLLRRLVWRAFLVSNISGAPLFRIVDACQPTMLIDEADSFLEHSGGLRNIINSGHSRGADVLRMDGGQLRAFNTFGAKVIAGIGKVQETIKDRSLTILVRRKKPSDKVASLGDTSPVEFALLRSKIARWVADHADAIRQARPLLPDLGSDRAVDNWAPLLKIAFCISPIWYERAVESAKVLNSESEKALGEAETLLYDIKDIFEAKRVDAIASADLIISLCEDPEKIWCCHSRGKALSPRDLAQLLGHFGIKSQNLRTGEHVVKGFRREQFADAFERYAGGAS